MTKYAHTEWDPLLFNSQFTQLKRKKMMLQKMTLAKKKKNPNHKTVAKLLATEPSLC